MLVLTRWLSSIRGICGNVKRVPEAPFGLRSFRRIGHGAEIMPSLTDSHNQITIYGPKERWTYWVDFGLRLAECLAQFLNLEHETRSGATIVPVSFLPVSNGLEWRRDES